MSRKNDRNREFVYVYGNNALSPVPAREEIIHEMRRKARNSARVRRNQERARRMGFLDAVVLGIVFLIAGLMLIHYLELRSDIVSRTQNIASLKTQLNTMKLENDEKYERLTTRVDLAEVRKIAETELNMSYAGQGQVQVFTKDESDYVHQVTDLPDRKK